MAPIAMNQEELGWFSQLGHAARNVKDLVKPKPPSTHGTELDQMQLRSFDLADAMEQGLSRQMTTGLVKPAPKGEKEKSLVVERKVVGKRSEYILKSEGGEALLVARGCEKDSTKIEIFIPAGGDPPIAFGPAFTMEATQAEGMAWVLRANQCDCCAYRPSSQMAVGSKPCNRDVAHIEHKPVEIGHHKMMSMKVDIPSFDSEGTPEMWCKRAGTQVDDSCKLCLGSRLPKWNPRLRSLTQEFYGRCTEASPKNVQLDETGVKLSGNARPIFLHGKSAENTYVLDYKYPLGMAQAFGIALSMKGWP